MNTLFWAVVWCSLCASSVIEGSSAVNQDALVVKKTEIFDSAIKDLLPQLKSSLGRRKMFRKPPKYMLDLYERYRRGNVPGISNRNVVRSLLPLKGRIRGDNMLVFNLSGVDEDERITKVQLNVFRKNSKFSLRRRSSGHRTKHKKILRMKLYDINEENLLDLETIVLAPKSYGWKSYNVTKSSIGCRMAKDSHNLLGVKFEISRNGRSYKTVNPRRIVKLRQKPFLVVFSKTLERDDANLLDVPNENGEVLTRTRRRTTFENDIKLGGTEGGYDGESYSRHLKSVVYDNEVTETEVKLASPGIGHKIPKTHPGILKARRIPSKNISDDIIPMPKTNRKRKWRKRFNHRRKKHKKYTDRYLPDSWQVFDKLDGNRSISSPAPAPAPTTTHQCVKQNLRIDFSEIGWGEWIISPKSFEANYCSGTCPFPLKKVFRPSNHATIQSIIHAIGVRPDVPAPSCVPDSMSSLTLLYFDEDLNVILKNYPKMIVDRCACR